MRSFRVLLLFGLLAMPAQAANVPSFVRTELANCTAAPPAVPVESGGCESFTWSGGTGQIEIYATQDPLGIFDGATATMEYSSDGGDSFQPVEGLLGGSIGTPGVRLVDLVMAEGWTFQLVITGGGGSESITWSVGRIAG